MMFTTHIHDTRRRPGFTIAELLVCIGVIGLLLSLLAPAVQSAREAARRTQCMNNLRQIGIAVTHHEVTYRHYPTNGWGFRWIGDPDRGTDEKQPGGWIYNTLPFLEEQNLRTLGAGLPEPAKAQALGQLIQTPVPLFKCPTRPGSQVSRANPDIPPWNAQGAEHVSKTDYAINEGDWISDTGPGPPDFATGDRPDFPWRDLKQATGISFQRSRIQAKDIRDGLSNTYLVGEKYVDANSYENGEDNGYDQSLFSGVDLDLNRWTLETPIQDGKGEAVRSFGSAHSGGCFFLYCDGSVRQVSYSIDFEVHRQGGNRRDLFSR